ncbi:calcium/proton exchanger [Dacryopinax primogenitus]|uniref:Vacuolar calcium ion transporter n=1 Tax=Dacryopinax primogenitus (strain DJM 731) TaxID=1858805 RepID=M5GAF7_DACPD|nr:calcium/proton exchanger [Dacryopinax primogenitus]EJU05819.1 calcium/proton exchanger [Dacryopinax primogenitus]
MSILTIFKSSWLNLLLVFIPIGWALHFVNVPPIVVFVTTFLAIIPLAALLSFATEELAVRVGETLGGLLNATLGNVVELIVAIIALAQCKLTVVQSSLIGSILSNLLLVLGMCFFAGGVKYSQQEFLVTPSQINSELLFLSVVAVLLPGAFNFAVQSSNNSDNNPNDDVSASVLGADILKMSHGVAVILLFIYICYLVFTLWSHASNSAEQEEQTLQMNVPVTFALLIIVTILVGVTAEFLVDSIDGVTATGGISEEWVGLILLPIVGNAAEHVTAVTVAMKDKLDLSIGVAVGSSIQISIFVIPLTVVLAWIMNKPLTMLFDPFESVVLLLAVLTVNYTTQDAKSNWLEGMVLMMLYVIVAVSFWFYPGYNPSQTLNLGC